MALYILPQYLFLNSKNPKLKIKYKIQTAQYIY